MFPETEVQRLDDELKEFKQLMWEYNFSRDDIRRRMRPANAVSAADLKRLSITATILSGCASRIAQFSAMLAAAVENESSRSPNDGL